MRETLFTDNELTVETIELEDLRRTVKAKDQKGISKKLPIEHFEVFDRVLESMQSLNITPGNIFAMGGRYAKRMTIVEELKGIQEKAPFTIHQMTNFTKGMMSADQNDLNTLWGFYNAGTAIMRPSQNEFSTVLEQNVNWADFLLSEYSSPEVNKVFLDVKEFNNRFDGYATAN